MKRFFLFLSVWISCVALAVEWKFETGAEGWTGGFTDYPVGQEAFYELAWGWENLPTPMDDFSKGLYLNGNNHSDDLFMFVKRQVEGLKPNTKYQVLFSTLIESNIPLDSIGIGGSPGESVFFKVGASLCEPCAVVENGYYKLNVDKGNQSTSGEHAHTIGHLANTAVDADDPSYQPKELSSVEPLTVMTNDQGAFWIFLGTDSGFEGLTRFYIAQVILDIESTETK